MRASNTLSGGESQRINLATSIGSSLVGSMYILDEPSIGLHTRDSQRLIKVLKKLRDIGNTVIVVEHDEAVMHQADQLIDMGPEAGEHGGEITYQGPAKTNSKKRSLTLQYLSGEQSIPIPSKLRKPQAHLSIEEASANNISNLSLDLPLGGKRRPGRDRLPGPRSAAPRRPVTAAPRRPTRKPPGNDRREIQSSRHAVPRGRGHRSRPPPSCGA